MMTLLETVASLQSPAPVRLTRLARIVQRAGLAWLFFVGIAVADSTPRGQFTVWAIGLPNGYVVIYA